MTDTILHTETDDETGIVLKIIVDDCGDTDSPLEYSEGIIFAVLHGRYQNPAKDKGLTSPEAIAIFGIENADDYAQFALYLYDHGSRTYRIGDEITQGAPDVGSRNPFLGRLPQGHAEFDSGRVGSIFVRREDFPEGHDLSAVAEATCEAYTDWANGNICGFQIEDEDGNGLDSCWGFIGDYDDSGCLEQARDAFNAAVSEAKDGLATAKAIEIEEANLALIASRPDLYAHA